MCLVCWGELREGDRKRGAGGLGAGPARNQKRSSTTVVSAAPKKRPSRQEGNPTPHPIKTHGERH